jgi:hypothetical protein
MVLPDPPRRAEMTNPGQRCGVWSCFKKVISKSPFKPCNSAELVFAFGVGLLAGARQAVHGGAAAGPVLQGSFRHHLVDDFFGIARFHLDDLGQIVEVKLRLGFELFLKLSEMINALASAYSM